MSAPPTPSAPKSRGAGDSPAERRARLALAIDLGDLETLRALAPAALPACTASMRGLQPINHTLHSASCPVPETVLSALLEAGASPDEYDYLSRPALSAAVRESRIACLRLLLRAGADPNIADRHGQGALHEAAALDDADATRALVSHGAWPDAPCVTGVTALHLAAGRGHVATVQALLEAGADPWRPDASGKHAAFLASRAGHAGVVAEIDRHLRARLNPPRARSPGHGSGPAL